MEQTPFKLCVTVILLLLCCCRRIKGEAVISPARTAYVCGGGQLELTCNTTGQFVEWSFSFTLNTRTLTSLSQTDQTSNLVVNSTTFTFSRISGENSFPLISRLLISPVGDTLNGTMVSCTDVVHVSSAMTSTVIIIVDYLETVMMHQLRTRLISEDYGNSSVTVTLEWSPKSSLYSYYVSVVPQVELGLIGSSRAQLNISYNIRYNVSVEAQPRCGRNNVTTGTHVFIELHYANCGNPISEIDSSMSLLEFSDPEPALEGVRVNFTCAPRLILTGPNSTTCMENGLWEPDPRDTQCRSRSPAACRNPAVLIHHSVAVMGYSDPLIEGSTISLLCPHGQMLTGPDTSTCMGNGEWDPDIRNVTCVGSSVERLTLDVKIAVGSSVAVSIVSSALFFIIGFVCGHFCPGKQKQSVEAVPPIEDTPGPTPSPLYDDIQPRRNEEEVKLKTNVAYGPVAHK